MSRVLKYKTLSSNAYNLFKNSEDDAGYDLCSAYNYIVSKKGKQLIKTDIAIEFPKGTYGRIASRSGLAWNNFIITAGGVIDASYRGNICVILYNLSDENFIIDKGDRIAQIICERIANTTLLKIDNLTSTDRGQKGFGSSGIEQINLL